VKQRYRLRRREDFDRAIQGRRVVSGRGLVAFAVVNSQGGWRVGVAVSRRVGGAVQRNRVRRRLREAARLRLLPPAEGTPAVGYDVVLIGRPAALEMPLAALEAEVAGVRSRLVGR
jgi:ribonuclease P protein component